MIPRVLLTLLAVFAVAIGCNRPGGPVVPVTPPGGATPAAGGQ